MKWQYTKNQESGKQQRPDKIGIQASNRDNQGSCESDFSPDVDRENIIAVHAELL